MGRRNFSDEHCGATEDEVIESLQEDFEDMQRTARTYAARCRDLEVALNEIIVATTHGDATLESYTWIKNRATKALDFPDPPASGTANAKGEGTPVAINGYQIKRLLDFVDSDNEAELTLQYVDHERPDGNSNDGEVMPEGLYAWFSEYPDEGSLWLPETPEEHLASVEPRTQSAPASGTANDSEGKAT